MQSKNTREKLLKAAIALFYRKGYPESTIREIGAKAKISNSIIYHYFENKEEMLSMIIKMASHDLVENLTDIQKRVEDPVECLKEMIRIHMVDWCFKRKKESKIIVLDDVWLTGKRKEENRIIQRKIYSIYIETLSELQQKGLLKDDNLTVSCFSIIGAISQSMRWFKDKGPLSKEEVAQKVIDFVFYGLIEQ